MSAVNLAKIIGKVVGEPRMREVSGGHTIAEFSVVTNEYIKGESVGTFHNVSCWNAAAQFFDKYFEKGSGIIVTGTLKTDKWDKDGQKHSKTYIVADAFNGISFLPKGKEFSGDDGYGGGNAPAPAVVEDDDPLPF